MVFTQSFQMSSQQHPDVTSNRRGLNPHRPGRQKKWQRRLACSKDVSLGSLCGFQSLPLCGWDADQKRCLSFCVSEEHLEGKLRKLVLRTGNGSRWKLMTHKGMQFSHDLPKPSEMLPLQLFLHGTCITCWGRSGVWLPINNHSVWDFWVWWSQTIDECFGNSKEDPITCGANLCSRLVDHSWTLPWTIWL